MKKLHIPFLLIIFSILSCEPEDEKPIEIMGLKPIYGSPEELEARTLPAREICKPGKIYTFGSYLLINELYEGIHLVDNTRPSDPQNLAFLKISGNVDMAVKDGFLYADHLTSIVVFDIREPENVKFLKAVEHSFNPSYSYYPPQTGINFECVDPEKGTVISWEETQLKNPKCFR